MKRFPLLLGLLLLCFSPVARAGDEITVERVLALMNACRAKESLPPLHLNEKLVQAAEDRMRDMEEERYWSHDSPEGRSPFSWLLVRHYPFSYAGENLAAGFETARLLVSSWMESPGHRANILGAEYDECGLAIIDGSTKGRATGKSIVVLFARKR